MRRTIERPSPVEPSPAVGLADIADRMLREAKSLAAAAAKLSVSPVIQVGMTQALQGWRERLDTTIRGLRQQNAVIADMVIMIGDCC